MHVHVYVHVGGAELLSLVPDSPCWRLRLPQGHQDSLQKIGDIIFIVLQPCALQLRSLKLDISGLEDCAMYRPEITKHRANNACRL